MDHVLGTYLEQQVGEGVIAEVPNAVRITCAELEHLIVLAFEGVPVLVHLTYLGQLPHFDNAFDSRSEEQVIPA